MSMIPLRDVPELVEALVGQKPDISTVHRWATNGRSGVRLRTICGAGCRLTTREWVEAFFVAVDRARWGKPAAPVVTLASRQRQHQAADKELLAMGC